MTNNYNNHSEDNFSFDKNKKNPFAMPDGYFNSFTDKLKTKIEIDEELKDFPLLQSLRGKTSFALPQNYFLSNVESLEQKLEVQSYAVLSEIKKSKATAFIPQNYFESFEQKILNKISSTNELEEFSILSAIQKQNCFIVEPSYFDSSAEIIKESYHLSIQKRGSILDYIFNFIFKPKVAFAYSIILILGVGSFFYFNQPSEIVTVTDCKTLACLEKEELLKELKMNDLSEESLYDLVDADALDEQLFGDENKVDSINNINTL